MAVTRGAAITKVQLLGHVLSLSCANYLRIPYCIHLPQNLGDRAGRGYEGLLLRPFVFAVTNEIQALAGYPGILPSPIPKDTKE